MQLEQLYSYEDMAKLFRVSENTVRRYIQTYKLKKIELSSRTIRFRESDILKMFEEIKNS